MGLPAGRVIHRLREHRQLQFTLAPQHLTRKINGPEEPAVNWTGCAVAEAETDDVFIDDIKLQAADGFTLAATLFLPRRARRKQAILINSATAVPRRIYKGFASYLAGRGAAVLTYDYRGIGGSRPKSLKGFQATMSDWARLDATAAIDWMRTRYKEHPLNVVGHSFGGQAVGLAPNNTEIQRTLFIAAPAAHWRKFASPERYRVYAMLRLGQPLVRMIGYVPGRLGIGEDMPKGVFLQWASWVMNPRYFFTDETLEGLGNFEKYRGELRAFCITDDMWATRSAVESLCSGFTSIEPQIVDIAPKDNNAGQIGHFGFFRPQHRTTLWRKAGDWLFDEAEVVEPVPAPVEEAKPEDAVPTVPAADSDGGIEKKNGQTKSGDIAKEDASAASVTTSASVEASPAVVAIEPTAEAKPVGTPAIDIKVPAQPASVDTADVERLLTRFHELQTQRPTNGSASPAT